MSTENNVLEITDAEQGQQRSENNELRKQLIEDGNQLQNGSTMVDVLSCNQHNNGGKQVNGEMVEDSQVRSRDFVSENVVNLSNRVLTSDEVQVLSRGLNFCPTPKNIDRFQLKKDLDEFGRRIKLKYYFDVGRDTIKRFKNKSKWVPQINEPMLDLFLNRVPTVLENPGIGKKNSRP